MVQQSEIINIFKKNFIIIDDTLFWAKGTRLENKKAGCQGKKGYIDIRIGTANSSKIYQAHRIIFALHHNYLPEIVDHIDRNPFNNCINNLRAANKQINAMNTDSYSHNTSGVKGVSFHKAGNKWTAQIKIDGKKKHLGSFNTIEDATKARKDAERFYWSNI